MEDKIILNEPDWDIILKCGYSENSVDLLQKLMSKNPSTRLTVTAALKHSWCKIKLSPKHSVQQQGLYNKVNEQEIKKEALADLGKSKAKRLSSKKMLKLESEKK